MSNFSNIYAGRRVLLTGHTGFKGSWLAFWLVRLGATVTGLSLSPETFPNHWDMLHLSVIDNRIDIRDTAAVKQIVSDTNPEIVFHLAAQPLVCRSYNDPLQTWSTNVMGTVNLLEACRSLANLRAMVVATTDKVYANQEWEHGYRETDRLGGHDPYSASKAASEIVVDSYRKAFFYSNASPLIATARAGNVIGGGDWSEDRLIPDLVRAVIAGVPMKIRYPLSTRPWQHVLECLSGYLLLGQKLLQGHEAFAGAWNFGPEVEDNKTVAEILFYLKNYWPEVVWNTTDQPVPHEAHLLYLNNSKSKDLLHWQPVWGLQECLAATADWYLNYIKQGEVATGRQLRAFIDSARIKGCKWATASI